MAAPAYSPQGSRAGLITALVCSIILLLVGWFLWIYSQNQLTKAEAAIKAEQDKYAMIVSDLSSEPLRVAREQAEQMRKEQPGSNVGAFEVTEQYRANLASMIAGTPLPGDSARNTAQLALRTAGEALAKENLTAPQAGNLVAAVMGYQGQVLDLNNQKKAAQAQFAQLQQQHTQLVTAHQQQVAGLNKTIADEQAKTQSESQKVETYRKERDQALAAMTEDQKAQLAAIQQAMQQVQQTVTQKDQEIKQRQDRIRVLESTLRKFQKNAKESIVRQKDGNITRLPGGANCYINLGVGDQIPVGMTFEVYDFNRGIPPLGDGLASAEDDQIRAQQAAAKAQATAVARLTGAAAGQQLTWETELPRGKGSIEVVSVGPGKTSLCKIIHVEPGQQFVEGDIVANLAYSPTIKFKWHVYGDFDLDNNGTPTSTDTAVIKRKIQEFGSQLTDQLNVDTDFLVMGLEPVVQALTPEEQNDPAMVDRNQKAEQARVAYNNVIERANTLGIPILNQNRFLYYTGSYDMIRR